MTTTDPRLIRRVLTVVATTIIVAGVVAMHSFMVGHGAMEQPERASAAAHAKPHQAIGMTSHAPASDLAPNQGVTALPDLTSATARHTSAMCLAVLPALALLVVLALLRRRGRQGRVQSRREVPQLWVGIRGSAPRRTTASMAQLCVLRT